MDDYFKTPITWHKKTGENIFGDPTQAAGEGIKVRIEYGQKLVRDSKGNYVNADALIICSKLIEIGDKLEISGRKHDVITWDDITDLDNKFLFREVYI